MKSYIILQILNIPNQNRAICSLFFKDFVILIGYITEMRYNIGNNIYKGYMAMQKIITRYITGVVLLSSLIILALSWKMGEYSAELSTNRNAQLKLEQLIQTLDNNKEELDNLTESLNEDYLTRAYAFAYIIQQNPNVLTSQQELERIKDLLIVDELHVIDAQGILFAGTVPKYFGMDFFSTNQTAEFISILEGSPYLIQDIRPNGAEQKIFQYIGVARQDELGIVQIGLAPTRLLEAQKRNEIAYIISRIPMDQGTSLFAVNKEDGMILAHSDAQYVNQNISVLGSSIEDLIQADHGNFIHTQNQKVYCVSEFYDNVLLCITYTKDVVYADRSITLTLTMIGILFISFIMLLTIHWLVRHHIVKGLHHIMKDVHEITDGNLNTTVDVEDNPEFKQLSTDINKMVQSILNATVKVTKVIEMVDIPIGVFEFSNDKKTVMATDRLRKIMNWDEAKAAALYQDKDAFMKELTSFMDIHKTNISNIYRISNDSDTWIQLNITMDEQGTFGVVSDVSKEMKEKMEITYERDHDALTNLKNITIFKHMVETHIQTTQGICGMLMMDIDNFKNINDTYGHDWGDTYLKICAYFLTAFENEHIISARRSGDEFCMFLYNFESKESIHETLIAFYKQIHAYEITFPDGSSHHIHLSAGLALSSDTCMDYESLMRAADIALYESKKHGKGILSIYKEE